MGAVLWSFGAGRFKVVPNLRVSRVGDARMPVCGKPCGEPCS